MPYRKQDHLYVRGDLSNSRLAIYLFFRTIPCLVAAIPIYLGYRLLLPDVPGKATLILGSSFLSAQLLNAAPGIFLAVGGVLALITHISKGLSVHANPLEASDEKSDPGFLSDLPKNTRPTVATLPIRKAAKAPHSLPKSSERKAIPTPG